MLNNEIMDNTHHFNSFKSLPLVNALVIQSTQQDGSQTILSMLRKFMNDDTSSNRSSLFRKIDIVREDVLNNEYSLNYIEEYQVICINSLTGINQNIWKKQLLINLWYLIQRGKLAIVFMRASLSKLAIEWDISSRKNFLLNYCDFIKGDSIELLCNSIDNLKSKNLEMFTKTLGDYHDLNIISLAGSYVSGIEKSNLVNSNDWNFLGKEVGGEKICWMVHKTKRIMFIPFFGYSIGNENQINLTYYSLSFLIHEHLTCSLFQRNLYKNRKRLSEFYHKQEEQFGEE